MRWVGNVARMCGRAVHTGFRCDNEMERVFGGTILEFDGGIWEYQERKKNRRLGKPCDNVQTLCLRSMKQNTPMFGQL